MKVLQFFQFASSTALSTSGLEYLLVLAIERNSQLSLILGIQLRNNNHVVDRYRITPTIK